MLQENAIEYHKQEGRSACRSYVRFYIKEDKCSAIATLWNGAKNTLALGEFFSSRAPPEIRRVECSHEILPRFARQDEGSNTRNNSSTTQLTKR